MTALASAAATRWAPIPVPRSLGWWLRCALSLALVVTILAVALPTAFGGGVWNGGIDSAQVSAPASSGSAGAVERRLGSKRAPSRP